MTLGSVLYYYLGCGSLENSLPFYELLGFWEINRHEGDSGRWAQLTDGAVVVLLTEGVAGAIRLMYFSQDTGERASALEQKGFRLADKQEADGVLKQAAIYNLNGVDVVLMQFALEDLFSPQGVSKANCGVFGELSLPTKELDFDAAVWQAMGFELKRKFHAPSPWCLLTDDLTRIGLHQSSFYTQPTFTYSAPDMVSRLKVFRDMGLHFTFTTPNEHNETAYAGVESPDGHAFFLIEDSE